MLSPYRYRSVLDTSFMKSVYFVIECSAIAHPNQRAVAKL